MNQNPRACSEIWICPSGSLFDQTLAAQQRWHLDVAHARSSQIYASSCRIRLSFLCTDQVPGYWFVVPQSRVWVMQERSQRVRVSKRKTRSAVGQSVLKSWKSTVTECSLEVVVLLLTSWLSFFLQRQTLSFFFVTESFLHGSLLAFVFSSVASSTFYSGHFFTCVAMSTKKAVAKPDFRDPNSSYTSNPAIPSSTLIYFIWIAVWALRVRWAAVHLPLM